MKYEPHDYQKRAIRFLLEKGNVGLFLDPGLGKTSICLSALKILRYRKLATAALVIAPLRVCRHVWPAEVEKFDEFRELSVGFLHGARKNNILNEKHAIYTINPEGLPWLMSALAGRDRYPFDVLIVDESTRFKHTNTQRFKLLRPVLPKFKRRIILTGTPAPNGLLDLFGQMFIVDLGKSLGRFITHYRNEFFYPGGYGGYTWLPAKGAGEAIRKKIAPSVMRLESADYLKLPKLFTLPKLPPVFIELPPSAREAYEDMEKRFLIELGPAEAWAANAAVASMKCRQIANGGIYVDEWIDDTKIRRNVRWESMHEEKTEAVVELIEELSGKPALIAYDFHHDRERLLAALGRDTPVIGSGIPEKREEIIIRAWNAGELPVLLANPQSIARGLNLQGGRAVIWHSITWNLEDYDQFIRRVWRQGQRETVFVYHIAARDTVDEVILAALGAKARTQNAFLGALKSYVGKRTARPEKPV